MVTEQLIDYVKEELSKGYSRELITQKLVNSNWKQDDIDQAFLSLDQNTSSDKFKSLKLSLKLPNWLKILLIIVLLFCFTFIFLINFDLTNFKNNLGISNCAKKCSNSINYNECSSTCQNQIKPNEIIESYSQYSFISWADTKTGTFSLASLSSQILALTTQPAFTIYEGDVQDDGVDLSNIDIWSNAFDGNSNNGIYNKTFLVRGNHDAVLDNSVINWQSFFDMSSISQTVGAKNYSFMPEQEDLTYSFDFNNSHFVGIDDPGDNTLISSEQINWLDQDLTLAEDRGLTHAFLYFHGPLYYVGNHPAESNIEIVSVINKHKIVSAIFNGHEHLMAYVHLDSTRIPELTRPIEQFVTGSAGAELQLCTEGRSDYCSPYTGFSVVDVKDNSFSVTYFKQNQEKPVTTWTFTK